jgi:hypothetical protein
MSSGRFLHFAPYGVPQCVSALCMLCMVPVAQCTRLPAYMCAPADSTTTSAIQTGRSQTGHASALNGIRACHHPDQVEITTASAKQGASSIAVPLSALLDSSTGKPVSQHFHCVVLVLDSTTALETQSKVQMRHVRDCCTKRGALPRHSWRAGTPL